MSCVVSPLEMEMAKSLDILFIFARFKLKLWDNCYTSYIIGNSLSIAPYFQRGTIECNGVH